MYYFIINPHSKSGKGMVIWNNIQTMLQEQNIAYQAIQTMYPGHATTLVQQLCQTHTKKILIILGGDGTLHEAIQGLHEHSPITIGYIPTGSGNDFARSLHIHSPCLHELSSLLHSTKIIEIDYGLFFDSNGSSRRFVVSCGVGFDAHICYQTQHSIIKKLLNKLHLGSLSYLITGIPCLFTHKSHKAMITLDDTTTIQLDHLFFTSVHIHPFEGGGFAFCPDADYQDGLLDLCIVNTSSLLKKIIILLSAFLRRRPHCLGVTTYRCKKATICLETATYFHIDGECPLQEIKEFTVVASKEQKFSFFLPSCEQSKHC